MTRRHEDIRTIVETILDEVSGIDVTAFEDDLSSSPEACLIDWLAAVVFTLRERGLWDEVAARYFREREESKHRHAQVVALYERACNDR